MDEKTIRFETDDGWLLIYPSFVKKMERFLRDHTWNTEFINFFNRFHGDYSAASHIRKSESPSIWYNEAIADKIIQYNEHFALKNYNYFYVVYDDGRKLKIVRN